MKTLSYRLLLRKKTESGYTIIVPSLRLPCLTPKRIIKRPEKKGFAKKNLA